MCTMLNIYYQVPISVLTLLKLKINQCQLKNEEPLNLNLEESSEVKTLHLPLVCVNENFKNQFLIYVQLIQEVS